MLRIPTGWRQTSWLYTSAAEELSQGLGFELGISRFIRATELDRSLGRPFMYNVKSKGPSLELFLAEFHKWEFDYLRVNHLRNTVDCDYLGLTETIHKRYRGYHIRIIWTEELYGQRYRKLFLGREKLLNLHCLYQCWRPNCLWTPATEAVTVGWTERKPDWWLGIKLFSVR